MRPLCKLTLLALLSMLVGCGGITLDDTDRTRLDELNTNLSSMRQELYQLRQQIAELSRVKEDIQLLAICFVQSQDDLKRLADAMQQLAEAVDQYQGATDEER